MLMLDTDMRRAEALGMTWSDVSVENRSILIEQQFAAFSVENGFGKFEGVRTYHYVKETGDGETISKRYEHKEWLELRDYLRKHPKVREAGISAHMRASTFLTDIRAYRATPLLPLLPASFRTSGR